MDDDYKSVTKGAEGPDALDFDEEELEEVAEVPHFDLMEEFLRGAEAKKSVKTLPKLIRNSFRLLWDAGPVEFVTSSALHVLNGIGVGAQLLIGKDVLTAFLAANKTGRGMEEALPQLLALMMITAAMKVASSLQSYQQQKLTTKVGRRTMDQVIEVACAVDLAAFEAPDFYDRMKRAELNSQIRPWQMSWGILGFISAVVGVAGIAIALVAIKWWLVPLVMAAYIPLWLLKKRNSKEEYALARALTTDRRELDYLRTVLTGRDEAKEVRAFNLTKTLRLRYDRLNDRNISERLKMSRRHFGRNLGGTLGTMALTAMILGFMFYLVTTNRMSLAAAGTAIAAVQMLATRTEAMLQSIQSLFETSLFLEDYVSFVDLRPVVEAARPTAPAPRGFQTLTVEGVSFSYPGSDNLALKNISLQMESGEIIALVGENGSGKTTLAKLLAGLYPPTGGEILWDGQDISRFDPETVAASIALIFQDFVRYKLPARENIGMGRHEWAADLDAIVEASRRSGAHRFLKGLPESYETVLAKEFPGGRDLSIGQWQRVALARAFFRDAPFIILDEPTAALDPKAERRLFDGIRSLTEGRTVLLISHRFSSVRTADRIYVLDEGEVAENGSHSELMALGGLYSELFTLQASAYLDSPVPK